MLLPEFHLKTIVIIFVKMKLVTAEAYTDWFTEIMTKELTDQIEIRKILEKQLKTENKAHKKDNAKLIKTNEKLQEEIRSS